MSKFIVHADEAGSTVPGSQEHSVFLGAALLATDTGQTRLESEVAALWSSGHLRKGTKGKRASHVELDSFTDLLVRQDEVFPSICYLRHDSPHFGQDFNAKMQQMNELAQEQRRATGANAKYMPESGHSANIMMWTYGVPMAVGLGLGVFVLRGIEVESVSIHLDDRTITPELRRLVVEQTQAFIQNALSHQVMRSLAERELPTASVSGNPREVTIDFRSSGAGGFAADYLCTIAFRALESSDPKRHDIRWLDKLIGNFGSEILTDVTTAVLEPLPPLRLPRDFQK